MPIYKTRSIGDQVFREVNIEEAIAASQTESSSQGDRWRVGGRSQSIDVPHLLDTNKKKSKRLFGRKVCIPYYYCFAGINAILRFLVLSIVKTCTCSIITILARMQRLVS